MLRIFRHKNVTKLVLWGILILILPAFVLWGSGSISRSRDGGPSYVGLIDNGKISFEDFAKSINAIRCQIILNYFGQPKVMDLFLNTKAFLAKLAWDRLIMLNEARKDKIKISDNEVVAAIRALPIFLRNGAFDDKIYVYILKHNLGMDPRTFEELIRDGLKIQKLNEELTKDIVVTETETEELYARENDKYKLSCLVFSSESFLDKTDVTEEEIREYYDMTQGMMTRNTAGASDKDENGPSGYKTVRDKIAAILKENRARELAIKEGTDKYTKIKELMEKESLDFGSAAGKLNLKINTTQFFSKNDSLENIGPMSVVAEKASKLKEGALSEPVETSKGIIIFKIDEKQTYNKESFLKERESYAKKAADIKKNSKIENWLKNLEEKNKVIIDFRDYEKYYK